MNPYVQIKRKPGRFRVGDRVRITRGFPGAEAEILEDHGILASHRYYTVRIKMQDTEDIIIDYPEDEMEPLAK